MHVTCSRLSTRALKSFLCDNGRHSKQKKKKNWPEHRGYCRCQVGSMSEKSVYARDRSRPSDVTKASLVPRLTKLKHKSKDGAWCCQCTLLALVTKENYVLFASLRFQTDDNKRRDAATICASHLTTIKSKHLNFFFKGRILEKNNNLYLNRVIMFITVAHRINMQVRLVKRKNIN